MASSAKDGRAPSGVIVRTSSERIMSVAARREIVGRCSITRLNWSNVICTQVISLVVSAVFWALPPSVKDMRPITLPVEASCRITVPVPRVGIVGERHAAFQYERHMGDRFAAHQSVVPCGSVRRGWGPSDSSTAVRISSIISLSE